MGLTTVSDYVIWTKHIHNDPTLAARIADLRAGETVRLKVNGEVGDWRKMDDGKDGRPTPGIRPIGLAKAGWNALYRTRRGATAAIGLANVSDGVAEDGARFIPGENIILTTATEEERAAAIERLLNAHKMGWRSDGERMSRDEMHER